MTTTTNSQNSQQQSRLLSLPAELLIEVISHLSEERKALCALARTCRSLQPFCEELIYTVIELLETSDLSHILEAFSRRFERIAAVHTLRILYKFHKGLATTVNERMAFNACVGEMKNLTEWHVESPYDNFKWEDGGNEWVERDMDVFRTALEKASLATSLQAESGLAKLSKYRTGKLTVHIVTLHTHGATSDIWDLGGFHCLFQHPSLQYLHVSCVNLSTDLPELERFASTTSLSTLIFDESEIEPVSLKRILSTPKSLKHLTLGENVFNIKRDQGSTPRLSRDPDAAIQALLPVAHSLETLIHYDPMFKTLADPERPRAVRIKGNGMRHFHTLKFLECDPCSFLHQGIICTPTLAPPNLETLRIRHPRRQPGNFFDQLPDFTPYSYLSSLRTLEFLQSTNANSPLSISEYVCERDRLSERHQAGFKLHQQGINMKCYIEIHGASSLIPPYLHREPTPDIVCLYDANHVGFIRKKDQPRGSGIEWMMIEDETAELNSLDILCLKNEVRRAVMNGTHQSRTSGLRRQTALQFFLQGTEDMNVFGMYQEDDSDEDDEDDEDDMDDFGFIDAEYELFVAADAMDEGSDEDEDEDLDEDEDEDLDEDDLD
ncbi:hypothetical protein K504DRAFT_392437 [Pleomassaria siparia CBS 279.74]|uniref:F-box domain-containing protein n=1 Tax=Pleomassaria siparia CBS 279.74 TaxID=1314801 RepID=A0A6G1JT32_9PLEO|nr:hypothetical protein K504DRAFT_392437 [Pleomassaria siparia CBS 279.74]